MNFVTTEQLELEEILNPNPYKQFEAENKYVQVTPLSGFDNSYDQRIQEANYIASEVIRLKKEDNAEYKDFAVLVRSHSQAEIIDKQLAQAGIPGIKKVNLGFFVNPVIKNALALLRLAGNIRDELALFRILKIALSDGQIYQLKKQIDNKILETKEFKELKRMNLSDKFSFIKETASFESLDIDEDSKTYVSKIFDILNSILKQKNTLSLLQIYYKLINEIKPYKGLAGIDQYKAELDLRVFEKIIADFMQSENYVSIKKFIEYIDRIKEDRNFELPTLAVKGVNAVRILTIHASKGLEFPYTFMTSISTSRGGGQDSSIISFDLQYGNKPGFGVIVHKFEGNPTAKALIYKEIWKKPRQKSEDLRLFYVAVSRAEKYLNILSFEPYGNYGGIKPIDYIKDFKTDLVKEPVDINSIEIEKQVLRSENLLPARINVASQENVIVEGNSPQISYKMSFSQINTFNHCSNKYLFKYKFGYPELTENKDTSLVGSIVHNLIYSSYVNKKALSENEISELLSEIIISNDDLNRVKSLYNSYLNSDYSPLSLSSENIFPEKSFNFTYSLKEKEIKFSGDIDLLVQNEDDTYTIIDFKTNKKIENYLDDYNKQLYLYKLAMEAEGLKIKEAKLVNLLEDSINEYILKTEDEPAIELSLKSEIDNVLSVSELKPKEQTQECFDCGYNYLCI